MTVFCLAIRSYQGPHSECLQTSETRAALCNTNTSLDYGFFLYHVRCVVLFTIALLTFAVFVVSLAVYVLTAVAAELVLWFQYRLSLVLLLLGQDDLQFIAPGEIAAMLDFELIFVASAGHICLIFVEM